MPDESDNIFDETDSELSSSQTEVGMFGSLDMEEDAVVRGHKENAEKLDVIIDIFINYLTSRKTEAERDDLFNVLIRVFDSLILSTHKSKYSQFLLFYMCQTKVEYVQQFLDFLCEKITTASAPTLLLQSSAAYIGSFVGRATFIHEGAILGVLSKLMTWLHNYVAANQNSGPDAQKHGVFYSVCQSVIYIFCFKHKQLESYQQSILLSCNKIIYASLNPLKLLLVDVVVEFVNICTRLGVNEPLMIFEQNKKLTLPTKSVYGGNNQLDSFFPFDPYLLKQSSRHFKGAYQFWKSSPVDESLSERSMSDKSPSPPGSPRRRRPSARSGGLSEFSLSWGACDVDSQSWGAEVTWVDPEVMASGSFEEEHGFQF